MAKQEDLFAILRPASGLKGLDSALLADLYDIVSKFGEAMDGGKVRRLRVAADPPYFVTAYQQEPRHITVSGSPSSVEVLADSIAVFGTQEKNSALMVGSQITVEDLRSLVARVDKEHEAFRNPLTGERMRIEQEITATSTKLCVEELFRNAPRGIGLSAGSTPESIASILDEPDKVLFLEDASSPGNWIMRLKRNVVKAEMLDAIMLEMMTKYGIDTVESFQALSQETKKAFHDEVLAEIERRQKEEEEKPA